MIREAARAALFGALLAACAPSLTRSYVEERSAAERAYAAGRYDESAEHWRKAERQATRKRDRTEARFRAAASLRRAGRSREARELYAALLRDTPKSSRAARAAFELADIEIEQGQSDAGYAALERALRKYPSAGMAPSELRRYLTWLEDHGGDARVLGYLQGARESFARTELAEHVEYLFADRLEKLGRSAEARARFVSVAERFPYPRGALWDDALYRAAELEARLGRPREAIALLERMLREHEPSSLQGSYTRSRFAQARFRIAELYRDALHDDARARREFQRVWDESPTSLLRDDALWHKARLEHAAGDRDDACSTLALLTRKAEHSRFAACARALCPGLEPPKAAGPCHDYVVRELGQEGSGEARD